MKLFLLSAFGLCVAMSVAAPPPPTELELQLQKLKEIVDLRANLLNELLAWNESGEERPAPAAVRCSRGPAVGLQTSSLTTGSLQPASGLQSGARGLTPEAEWRRMFPHKPGYSR